MVAWDSCSPLRRRQCGDRVFRPAAEEQTPLPPPPPYDRNAARLWGVVVCHACVTVARSSLGLSCGAAPCRVRLSCGARQCRLWGVEYEPVEGWKAAVALAGVVRVGTAQTREASATRRMAWMGCGGHRPCRAGRVRRSL
jgi:hypothetical protein